MFPKYKEKIFKCIFGYKVYIYIYIYMYIYIYTYIYIILWFVFINNNLVVYNILLKALRNVIDYQSSITHHDSWIELSKRVTRPYPPRVDDLVNQPNPAHFLASQKNSNPTQPTTGYRVKRVGSRVHLI